MSVFASSSSISARKAPNESFSLVIVLVLVIALGLFTWEFDHEHDYGLVASPACSSSK